MQKREKRKTSNRTKRNYTRSESQGRTARNRRQPEEELPSDTDRYDGRKFGARLYGFGKGGEFRKTGRNACIVLVLLDLPLLVLLAFYVTKKAVLT